MLKLFRIATVCLLLSGTAGLGKAAPQIDQSPVELKHTQRQAWRDLKRQQDQEKKSFYEQRHTRQERKLFKQQLKREKALLRSAQRDQNQTLKQNRRFTKEHPQLR